LSDIRVTYSGLIAFVVGVISVFTGLFFTLIITRKLSPEEFGTWVLIGHMIFFFLVTERIISYWTIRQIARNEKVGRTSILSSISFSFGSIPIYLLFVIIVAHRSNVDLGVMFLGAILIPVQFVSQTLNVINLGHKPHVTSYSLLLFEAFKVPAGLSLVYFLGLGVEGAIIAIFVAYLARISLEIYFARQKLKEKFRFSTLRRWIKLSWISLYSHLSNNVWHLDAILYSLITGSVIGVAYYGVSMTIAGTLQHAGLISQALYPKLLAKGSYEHIKRNFTLMMYFAIPLLGLSVIFSRPALFALNPLYEEAYLIVIILSFKTFFLIFRNLLDRILLGIETIDVEHNPSFSKLRTSKLFFVPTRKIIHFAIYIISLVIILHLLNSTELPELELVMWWTITALLLEIPFFIYLLVRVQKITQFSFPYVETFKFAGSTIIFSLVFFLLSDSIITYEISIFQHLPSLILMLAICIGVYLVTTFMIDKETRILFKTILNELISKK